MKTTPRSFRLSCTPEQVSDVEALLQAEGFSFAPEPFYALARTLVHEPVPLGRSLAARFGYIYIQDKSSMLPPLALAPHAADTVLDVCASPGSKTSLLSALVGAHGLVVANEPSPDRLATLRVNMRHLGCCNVITCKYPGQELPLPHQSCSHILLDAPCSGWGTVEKNPQAMRMWSADKTQPLEALQRDLLRAAHALLAPGGELVYSTCTTNERENEDQICFARDELGLEVCELSPFPGFSYARSLPGCLLVHGEQSQAQGFFLAKLRKSGQKIAHQPMQPHRPPAGQVLSAREFMAQTGLNTDFLPAHSFLAVNGRLYLMREAAQAISPDLRWQGFSVGKIAGKTILPDPTLRVFMPHEPDEHALVVDACADIHALLAGQSRTCSEKVKKKALYYRNLPLGFLTVKGSRCLWTDR